VQCWGIPLVAWDAAQIRKLVAAIGELVEIDDDIEKFRRLDRARVLITLVGGMLARMSRMARLI